MEGQRQRSFEVTAAAQKASLGSTNAGEVAFTVTNKGQGMVKGRLGVKPHPPAEAGWFTIDGESTRDFGPGAAEQVVVKIAVPAGATAGSYAFQLNAWNEALPDEDYTEGQSVALEVKPTERKKPFPWWIVAIAAVVLIGIGVTVALVSGGDESSSGGTPEPPAVTGPQPPELVAPADDAEFGIGDEVLFDWNPVEGADAYRLEVDKCSGPCTGDNANRFETREAPGGLTQASVPLGEFSFGQWRVVALSGEGEVASETRRFRRRPFGP